MAGTIIDSELNSAGRSSYGVPALAGPGGPAAAGGAEPAKAATPCASDKRIHFRLAEPSDDNAIRQLLRTNPMPGAISLTFEREPNFFSATGLGGANDQTILAFDSGRLVCMGRCSVRRRYINGVPKRVGYLADLRLDKSAQGRFDILRRGYRFFHESQGTSPADFYFTSVAADNERSLRFLERGLAGMPSYEFLSDFVTLLIPVRRRRVEKRGPIEKTRLSCVSHEQLPQIVQFLNEQSKACELAACWTADDLEGLACHGLAPHDFQLAHDGTSVLGCAALWDQRKFKQTVIRGYSRGILLSRPWLNLAANLLDTLRLPAVGSTLAQAFLCPLAVAEGREDILLTLLEQALHQAAIRGLEFLTLGFGAGDWKLDFVRKRFRCRLYHTRIYQVRWAGTDRSAGFPTCRIPGFQPATHPNFPAASSDREPRRIVSPEVSLL